jgi:Xaa-Pro dipeptidase
MRDFEVDFCLCSDPANIYYLTNFTNLVHERPVTLIISRTSLDLVVAQSMFGDLSEVLMGPVEAHAYTESRPVGRQWSSTVASFVEHSSNVAIDGAFGAELLGTLPAGAAVVHWVCSFRGFPSQCVAPALDFIRGSSR